LFTDFFSRFQSKSNHFRSSAKHEKLSLIHLQLQHFSNLNLSEEDSINNFLKNLIVNAATIEFETYLEINRSVKSYSSKLSNFYPSDNSTYLQIKNSIQHKKQYGWKLDIQNYGSTFQILSTQFNSLFTQNAIIKTKEFWKLCWIDKDSNKLQFRFESLGEHTYLLSKNEKGGWKILENMIKTQNNKIEPEYIDYTMLKQISSNNQAENKIITTNFIANNELLHCIEFIKIVYADNLPNSKISLLNRIRESYLNSHRLLNTDVINFAVYKSEIELLQKQLELISISIFLSNKKNHIKKNRYE
jgi:hypothetical protein